MIASSMMPCPHAQFAVTAHNPTHMPWSVLTALSSFAPACAAYFSPSFLASVERPGISDLIFADARETSPIQ